MGRNTYVIDGGAAGRNRLRVLSDVFGPATRDLLSQVGIPEGAMCLDLGCGGGEVTRELAQMVGPTGAVLGVDYDAVVLDAARQETVDAGLVNVSFASHDVTSWEPEIQFDVIYARFIFSHLVDPSAVMASLRTHMAPGGIMIVEDVDFRGHFSEPRCPALTRYTELYSQSARNRGADPWIGPKIPGHLHEAGFENIKVQLYHPVALHGGIKQLTYITLANIGVAALRDKLTTEEEFTATLSELAAFADDTSTLMGGPRTFQVWGRNPVVQQFP
jgi:ubiquinone/menaquinone biosynthesis C-methylase UbiE